MPKIYSARWVLPIASPPIDNGAVLVDDSVIVAVGARSDLRTAFPHEPHEDFGNAAMLPGLINAHSHLELTIMRGFLEREEHDFFAWLKKLTIARLKMTDEDLKAVYTFLREIPAVSNRVPAPIPPNEVSNMQK